MMRNEDHATGEHYQIRGPQRAVGCMSIGCHIKL